MIRLRLTALSILALAGSSHVARAQMGGGSSRPISLVVSGGLTVPAGDLKNLHDSGFHYDASLLLNLPGLPLTLRPEFSLTRLKLKDPVGTGGGYGSSGDVTQLLGAIGNIELPLVAGLYVLAGGGVLNVKTPAGTPTLPTEGDNSQNKFTFDAGAGLRFKLGGIRGFFEGRVGTATYDTTGEKKFTFEKATYIPITFGLVF